MEEIVEMVKWEFFKKLLVKKLEEIGQVGGSDWRQTMQRSFSTGLRLPSYKWA